MNFLNRLLSSKSETSSKRFISLVSLFVFILVIFSSLYLNLNVSDTIIYGLVSLILGGSAMTLITNKNINKNEDLDKPSIN